MPRTPRPPFTHLTRAEREIIRRMLAQKRSLAEIARVLGKSRATISREVRRNRSDLGGGHFLYVEVHAQAFTNRRRLKAKEIARRIEGDEILQRYIEDMLKDGLSPEQVAGLMRRINHTPRVCTRTIYAWIHRRWQSRKAYLRYRGKPRSPYGSIKNSWDPNKRHISERPFSVSKRSRIGDWEADLVHGTQDDSRHCLLTLVERLSGFGIVLKLRSTAARYVAGMIVLALTNFPVRTITCDNGSEFARHAWMEKQLDCEVYFSDPNSPQQRGSIENLNGLLREFYLKGKSLRHVTQHDVNRVAQRLNMRPRKRLGFECPRNVLARHMGISPYAVTLKHEY